MTDEIKTHGTNGAGDNTGGAPECAPFEPQLSTLALGELDTLDESARRELEEHVQSCARCQEEVEQLKNTARVIARLAPPAETFAPERRRDVLAAAAAGVAPAPEKSATVMPFHRWVSVAAAAAVLLCVAGFFAFEHGWLGTNGEGEGGANVATTAGTPVAKSTNLVEHAGDSTRLEGLNLSAEVSADAKIGGGGKAGAHGQRYSKQAAPAPAPPPPQKAAPPTEAGGTAEEYSVRVVTRGLTENNFDHLGVKNLNTYQDAKKLQEALRQIDGVNAADPKAVERLRSALAGASKEKSFQESQQLFLHRHSLAAESPSPKGYKLEGELKTVESALMKTPTAGTSSSGDFKQTLGETQTIVKGRSARSRLAGGRTRGAALAGEPAGELAAPGISPASKPATARKKSKTTAREVALATPTDAAKPIAGLRDHEARLRENRPGERGTTLGRGGEAKDAASAAAPRPTRRSVAAVAESAPKLDEAKAETKTGAKAKPEAARTAAIADESVAGKREESDKGVEEIEEESEQHARSEPAADGATASPDDPARGRTAVRYDAKAAVDRFLAEIDRVARDAPDTMIFHYWGDNDFVDVKKDNKSTFGAEADTASYTLMRNYIKKRRVIPPEAAVRTEEFINYFKSGFPAPESKDSRAFSITTEVAPSIFAHDSSYQLLQIGLKGRVVTRETRKPTALSFVVDTSGSMRRENRLELVKDALRLMVAELDESDTIGIVAFDRTARTILESTSGGNTEALLNGISALHCNSSTNVDAGLQVGYKMAADNFLKGGVNRVMLFSDGVANTGVTIADRILERVKVHRQKGVYLTCVGVGMGNHNDALMERLADRGDGQCVYIDRLEEAQKVLVDNFTGTLEAIARDVKIQVEFEKDKVIRFRQLGYENRRLTHAQFRDNTVDAGEIGAGHEVKALYEVKLAPGAKGKVATVRVRYQTIDHNEAVELKHEVAAESIQKEFEAATPRYQLTALVAEFAEVLRNSYWARGSDLDKVAEQAEKLLGDGPKKVGRDEDVAEFVALVKAAKPLVAERNARVDEVAQLQDQLRHNSYRRHGIERVHGSASAQELEQLLRQRGELSQRLLDALRRR